MRYSCFYISLWILFFTFSAHCQDTIKSNYDLSLKELTQIKVLSVSLEEEDILIAPSNITVITKEIIEERGYMTLVEICEDIPGFDFMMFEDGGGEYPTYNMNRGVGTIGNEKLLIMVDGIVQNEISYNWSLLWTFENLLTDVERIEIIQGPGSAIYGAQAFTGVIHFITKSDYEGVSFKSFYGSNLSRGLDLHAATNIKKSNFSFALHKYTSKGDEGDRYDPGNYFHNNLKPDTILEGYDSVGNYITNYVNTDGGEPIQDGFSTWWNTYSFRTKLKTKLFEIGAFYWEKSQGSASYMVAYEYDLNHQDFMNHSRGYHGYLKNKVDIKDVFTLKSTFVIRGTDILPKTGFQYFYRFPDMTKNYVAYSYQFYIEENLQYKLSEKANVLLGLKGTNSNKSQRIVSLDFFPDTYDVTESSWEEASIGNGLGVKEKYTRYRVNELALYSLWNHQWNNKFHTSIGLRYDGSSEYGQILNPRVALVFIPRKVFAAKLLYGTAFRQPSIFELSSEFRGNPYLEPEKIYTTELEINGIVIKDILKLKTNVFYSFMEDFIGKVEDHSMPAGERYENHSQMETAGLSSFLNFVVSKKIRVYANYMFLIGKYSDNIVWRQIERTAKNKINAGININLIKEKIVLDCRTNFVGKRKAPQTNTWLQVYKNGFAPSYKKVNLAVTWKINNKISAQLVLKNILNEQFYGVGRENGSGFIDDYDYLTNPNPDGFIPSYHPQPGRNYLINLKVRI